MTEPTKGHVRLRIAPGVPLVRLKNPQGKLRDHYAHLGSALLPEWADHDPVQLRHLLDHGLVELADDAGRAADPGRAWECLSALIACDVPEDAGAPRARETLRRNGLPYSNEAICEAIRLRKSGAKYQPPA